MRGMGGRKYQVGSRKSQVASSKWEVGRKKIKKNAISRKQGEIPD